MTRKVKIAVGEYYHIMARGNYKQIIFIEERDYIRFLFCLLYFQSPIKFSHLPSQVSFFEKNKRFNIKEKTILNILNLREVALINFSLMPNHFHCSLYENIEGGISRYMERVLKSYTKYFNIKYQKIGHLFQGPFKNKHISNNTYLLHLSAYIHRNPRELKEWRNKEECYPWSSYKDYTLQNRWGDLLNSDIILEQFNKNKSAYKKFLNTSLTKKYKEEDF